MPLLGKEREEEAPRARVAPLTELGQYLFISSLMAMSFLCSLGPVWYQPTILSLAEQRQKGFGVRTRGAQHRPGQGLAGLMEGLICVQEREVDDEALAGAVTTVTHHSY